MAEDGCKATGRTGSARLPRQCPSKYYNLFFSRETGDKLMCRAVFKGTKVTVLNFLHNLLASIAFCSKGFVYIVYNIRINTK